jgi:hypothetical protein
MWPVCRPPLSSIACIIPAPRHAANHQRSRQRGRRRNCRAVTFIGDPPVGSDAVLRPHHRSPAVAMKPAERAACGEVRICSRAAGAVCGAISCWVRANTPARCWLFVGLSHDGGLKVLAGTQAAYAPKVEFIFLNGNLMERLGRPALPFHGGGPESLPEGCIT